MLQTIQSGNFLQVIDWHNYKTLKACTILKSCANKEQRAYFVPYLVPYVGVRGDCNKQGTIVTYCLVTVLRELQQVQQVQQVAQSTFFPYSNLHRLQQLSSILSCSRC